MNGGTVAKLFGAPWIGLESYEQEKYLKCFDFITSNNITILRLIMYIL